jgi:hypothetical protein
MSQHESERRPFPPPREPRRSRRGLASLVPVAPLVVLAGLASCGRAPSAPAEDPREAPVASGNTTGTTGTASGVTSPAKSAGLTRFESEGELEAYVLEAMKRLPQRHRGLGLGEATGSPAAAAPAPPGDGAAKAEDVTNNQHAGVDEGGIVKTHGDHLVVLRRGRLFTVKVGDGRVGDGTLEPVSAVDAFGPDVDPRGTWYDELLVHGDTVAVVGFSYARGGTEIGLFDLDRAGKLTYRATHQLKSNDYYSSRNYASRVVGGKLVFYSPLHLAASPSAPFASFAAARRWQGGATPPSFTRIADAKNVYRPIDGMEPEALHTVTVCDLAARELDCKATTVMGPHGRVFYVSPEAVYVWTVGHQRGLLGGTSERAAVMRLPLDGGAPGALRVSGAPVDQFSFHEADGSLNVVVRGQSRGDGMWAPELTAGDVALVRVPVSQFSASAPSLSPSQVRLLPKPEGHVFQNRFVGDHLLYGTGSSWGRPSDARGKVTAVRYASSDPPVTLELEHGVDRLEALGRDALVVGSSAHDLHLTTLSLGSKAALASHVVRAGASQGELRSHGFFYRATGPSEGLLGLPIRSGGAPGSSHLVQGSASILFLQNRALDLREVGELRATPSTGPLGTTSDACKASCVDWYGNARPLFLKGRMFALLGYELVEGVVEAGAVREVRRVSFAPQRS